VEIDAASNGGVSDSRDLRERAMYAPSGDDRYKVYIIDEAHMLSRDAWNALLKVLEEPPPRVVFVFATTEAQKVLPTVISRLQRFDLKRISPAEIRERLAAVLTEEGITFDLDALGMIAGAADGGLRDALSLTDQVLSLGETAEVTSDRVRTALGLVPEDEYLLLLDIIAQRRAAEVFPAVQRQAAELVHTSNLFRNDLQAELARRLVGYAGPGRVFFCNSGAEANEFLIKLARLWGRQQSGGEEGRRYTVVTALNSFHGRTFGGMPGCGGRTGRRRDQHDRCRRPLCQTAGYGADRSARPPPWHRRYRGTWRAGRIRCHGAALSGKLRPA
jgi:DNA polymerase III subunit gamma/tau